VHCLGWAARSCCAPRGPGSAGRCVCRAKVFRIALISAFEPSMMNRRQTFPSSQRSTRLSSKACTQRHSRLLLPAPELGFWAIAVDVDGGQRSPLVTDVIYRCHRESPTMTAPVALRPSRGPHSSGESRSIISACVAKACEDRGSYFRGFLEPQRATEKALTVGDPRSLFARRLYPQRRPAGAGMGC
jgi:hypothetical protein